MSLRWWGWWLPLIVTFDVSAQWTFQGRYTVEPGYQTDVEARTLQHALGLDVISPEGWLTAGMVAEQFDPGKPQSLVNEGEDLYQRYLKLQRWGWTVHAGSLYTSLGRGLTLKSYTYAPIALDRQLDGLMLGFDNEKISVTVFSGKMVGLNREDELDVDAAELAWSPWEYLRLGLTGVKASFLFQGDREWQSAFLESNTPWFSLYGEWAWEDSDSPWLDPKALYGGLNLFLGSATLLAEWKDYQDFNYVEGQVYFNDPPTLVQEHPFALWNRHQYALNAANEEGYLLRLQAPLFSDQLVLTLQEDHTTYQNGIDVFTESFVQTEWWFGQDQELHVIAGRQKDFGHRFRNLGVKWHGRLLGQQMEVTAEWQKRDNLFFEQKDQSQAWVVEWTPVSMFSLAMIGEHTDDAQSDKTLWSGLKTSWNLNHQMDFSLFFGSRRQGKLCAGGICVYTPEFEGVEATFNLRLSRGFGGKGSQPKP